MITLSSVNLLQIIATIAISSLVAIVTKMQNSPLSLIQRFKNKPIRVSISYLYKIYITDEVGKTQYLLVQSPKTKLFQPAGGVYKYKDKNVLHEFKAIDHDSLRQKNDLRIQLPRKKLGKLINRFNENKSDWREKACHREFQEELLDTNILSKETFNLLTLDLPIIRRETSGLRFSKHFQMDEYIIYDIIEPKFNDVQKQSIMNLYKNRKTSSQFIFATKDEINRGGYCSITNQDNIKISEHSPRIY